MLKQEQSLSRKHWPRLHCIPFLLHAHWADQPTCIFYSFHCRICATPRQLYVFVTMCDQDWGGLARICQALPL